MLESADSNAAASQLFNLGITPIEISQTSAPAATGESALSKLFQEKVTQLDIMLFSRQMYTLLKAGVPIMRALAGLQESTTNKTFSGVIKEVRESLDAGRELSPSLARQPRIFSPFYVSMVRVGEMTGQLEEVFLRMFHHLEFEKFMREQVKSAIRYPSFVIATMAVAIVIINLFVIPAFAKVFKGFNAELPLMTQILINFSNFTVAWWPALLIGVICAVVGFRTWTKTPAGSLAWDEIKLKIPIAGKIILKATLSRFARSFALASRSGVRLAIDAEALPAMDGALEVIAVGEKTGGDRRNRDYAGPHVTVAEGVDPGLVTLAYDPQTAGGFLVAMAPERAAVLEATFAGLGLFLQSIGAVEEGAGVLLR